MNNAKDERKWEDRKTTLRCPEVLTIRVPAGAKEEVRRIAEQHGLSAASYIRMLIIADNGVETCPRLMGITEDTPKE